MNASSSKTLGLMGRIEEFLKTVRHSEDGTWPSPTAEDISAFKQITDEMIQRKWGADEDRWPVVTTLVMNHKTNFYPWAESLHKVHQESCLNKKEQLLLANMATISKAMKVFAEQMQSTQSQLLELAQQRKAIEGFALHAEMAEKLEPVSGDVLPAVGSTVLIHLGSSDRWVEHTVVGYYAWESDKGGNSAQRVFVRVQDKDGYVNSRLLQDIKKPDGSYFLKNVKSEHQN